MLLNIPGTGENIVIIRYGQKSGFYQVNCDYILSFIFQFHDPSSGCRMVGVAALLILHNFFIYIWPAFTMCFYAKMLARPHDILMTVHNYKYSQFIIKRSKLFFVLNWQGLHTTNQNDYHCRTESTF